MDFNTLYNNIKKKKNYNSQRPNHNSKIFRLVIYPQQINVTQKKKKKKIDFGFFLVCSFGNICLMNPTNNWEQITKIPRKKKKKRE